MPALPQLKKNRSLEEQKLDDNRSSQDSQVLNSILQCKTSEEVLLILQQSEINSNLEIQAAFVKTLYENKSIRALLFNHLVEIESLYFAKLIFHNQISSFCLNGKNLLGLCIEAKDSVLFKNMLREDIFNLHEVGTQFNGTVIQWLLKLGSQNEAYIEFYTHVGSSLTNYINKCSNFFHRSVMQYLPQSNLPHMLRADETFSPLSYLISQGGTVFAKELLGIEHEDVDWNKELGFRSKYVTCPLWIPYLPVLYPSSSEVTLSNLVELGEVGNSAYKLINILVDSLLDTSDRNNYSQEDWKTVQQKADTVFNNILHYRPLFTKLEAALKKSKLLKEHSALQKLVIFSSNHRIEEQLKAIGDDLFHKSTVPCSLLTMYGVISAVIQKHSSAAALCRDATIDDLQAILNLLAVVLSSWNTPLLDDYISSYGYTNYGIKAACSKANLRHNLPYQNRVKTQIQGEDKEQIVSGARDEEEMRSKLQALEFTFCDLTKVKQADLDKDLAEIKQELNNFKGRILKEFNGTLKTLQNKKIQYYRSVESQKQRAFKTNLIQELNVPKQQELPSPPLPKPQKANVLKPVSALILPPTLPLSLQEPLVPEEKFTTITHRKLKSAIPKSLSTHKAKSRKPAPKPPANKATTINVATLSLPSKPSKAAIPPEINIIVKVTPNDVFIPIITDNQEFPPLNNPKQSTIDIPNSSMSNMVLSNTVVLNNPLEVQEIKVESQEESKRPLRPILDPMQEANETALAYFFQYLEQMLYDLKIVETQLTTQYSDVLGISEIIKTAESNAIRLVQKTAQIVETIRKNLPALNNSQCNPEQLWNLIKSPVEPQIAAINKLEQVGQSIPTQSDTKYLKRTYLFHLWNAFLAAHLDTLDRLQLPLKSTEGDVYLDLRPDFFALSIQLHHSFLPLRFKTDEEYLMHNMFQILGNSIKKELETSGIGTYMQTVEGGTAVGSYLDEEPSEHSDYDIQSVVQLYDLKSYTKFEEIVNNTIEKTGKTGLVPFICITHKSTVSEEEDFCLWTLAFSNGRTVDWRIVLRPLELTIHDRMFPLAQLYYDLLDGFIFNPKNNFSLGTLLQLEDFIPEDIQKWKADNLKMAFIAKTLAKVTIQYEKQLQKNNEAQEHKANNQELGKGPGKELVSMVREVFNSIKINSMEIKNEVYEQILSAKMKMQTTLTTLFGKRSLSIAGFHAMIMRHDIVSVFGLDLCRDKKYLEHIKDIFIRQETQEPGWSRPAKGHITSVDYLAVLLSRVLYCKNEESKWNNPGKPLDAMAIRKQITTIAFHCLGRPYFVHALETAYAIETTLLYPPANPSTRARYLCTFFHLGVLKASKELKVPPRSSFLHRKKNAPLSSPVETTVAQRIVPIHISVPCPVAVYQPPGRVSGPAAAPLGFFSELNSQRRNQRQSRSHKSRGKDNGW